MTVHKTDKPSLRNSVIVLHVGGPDAVISRNAARNGTRAWIDVPDDIPWVPKHRRLFISQVIGDIEEGSSFLLLIHKEEQVGSIQCIMRMLKTCGCRELYVLVTPELKESVEAHFKVAGEEELVFNMYEVCDRPKPGGQGGENVIHRSVV